MANKHYQVEFNEINPDSISITKIEEGREPETHYYQNNAFEIVGACNCQHFTYNVYKKRENLIRVYNLQDPNTPNRIIKESGTCIHEKIIRQMKDIIENVQNHLNNIQEKPWNIRILTNIGQGSKTIHEQLNIKTAAQNETTWLNVVVPVIIQKIITGGPQPQYQLTNNIPPDWVWKNQKIIQKAVFEAKYEIQHTIEKYEAEIETLIQTAYMFLKNRLQQDKNTTIQDFLENYTPTNTSPIAKKIIEYIYTPENLKETGENLEIHILQKEALKKRGEKIKKFLEIHTK